MKKSSIKRNYIYNLLYEILTILVPLVTTPHISRVLGAQGVGIYSYTNSIVTYFTIFAALGTTVYGRREIAYVQNDREVRSRVFWEIVLLRVLLTLVCYFCYSIYALSSKYKTIAIVQSIYIISIACDITWFFQGMEEFGKVVLRNSLVKIANMAFILFFVQNEEDVLIYVFGLAALPLIGFLVTWLQVSEFVVRVPVSTLRPFRHFKGSAQLFLPTVISQIYLMMDKTLLGFFTVDTIENGYYEQSQKILQICWMFVTTMSTVMAPRIAVSYAKQDKQQIRTYLSKSIRIVWLVAFPIAFGLFSVASHMVPWFMGAGFMKTALLMKIGAWCVLPIGIYSITGAYLVGAQYHSIYSKSCIMAAALNLTLNILMIPRWFSVAAECVSLATHCMIAFVQIRYIVFQSTVISIKDIFAPAKNYLISSLPMCLLILMLSLRINCTMIGTMILVVVGACSYFMLLLIIRDPVILEVLKKVPVRFRR